MTQVFCDRIDMTDKVLGETHRAIAKLNCLTLVGQMGACKLAAHGPRAPIVVTGA